MFLFLDPPDHTRLRKLVSKAFVPKVVNELQPDITELVDGLLDRIAEQGRFDVVSDLGLPAAGGGHLPAAGGSAGGRAGVRPCIGAAGAGAGPVLHDHWRAGGGYGGAHSRRSVAARNTCTT